jgi:hypothetical protein
MPLGYLRDENAWYVTEPVCTHWAPRIRGHARPVWGWRGVADVQGPFGGRWRDLDSPLSTTRLTLLRIVWRSESILLPLPRTSAPPRRSSLLFRARHAAPLTLRPSRCAPQACTHCTMHVNPLMMGGASKPPPLPPFPLHPHPLLLPLPTFPFPLGSITLQGLSAPDPDDIRVADPLPPHAPAPGHSSGPQSLISART